MPSHINLGNGNLSSVSPSGWPSISIPSISPVSQSHLHTCEACTENKKLEVLVLCYMASPPTFPEKNTNIRRLNFLLSKSDNFLSLNSWIFASTFRFEFYSSLSPFGASFITLTQYETHNMLYPCFAEFTKLENIYILNGGI
jgi:hypothetical protein